MLMKEEIESSDGVNVMGGGGVLLWTDGKEFIEEEGATYTIDKLRTSLSSIYSQSSISFPLLFSLLSTPSPA